MSEQHADAIDPTNLSSEALRPASSLLNLASRFQGAQAQRLDARRGPGRPRGSTTGAIKPDGIQPPPGQPQQPPKKTEAELERERKQKKQDVDDLTKEIVEKLNRQILDMVSAAGVPSGLLYKDGGPPPKQDSNLTPLAQAISIQEWQAKSWATFLVEMRQTGSSKETLDKLTSGTTGLVIKGAIALVGAGVYAKGLATTYAKLRPFLEAKKRNDDQRSRSQFGQQPWPQQPPSQEPGLG